MRQIKPILIVGISLLFLFGVGKSLNNQLHLFGANIGAFVTKPRFTKANEKDELVARIDELMVENHLLKEMISQLKEDQGAEVALSQMIEKFMALQGSQSVVRPSLKDLGARIERQMRFIRAKVVFREAASWGSYCWVDRGSQNGEGVVKVNSPVVIGENVVGVIDFVGKTKSRIQLITDSRLPISVQATRGREQQLFISHQIEKLLSFVDGEFVDVLEALKVKLSQGRETQYLCKGQVYGSSYSLLRKRQQLLSGVSFEPTQGFEVGDLLTTTGMDGLFPRGFHVGVVTSIKEAQEGDITHEFEAVYSAQELDELRDVEILPAMRLANDFRVDSL